MEIVIGEPKKHEVHDYDFKLDNGLLFQITVDEAAGDSIDIGETHTVIHFSKKASRINPREMMPEEDLMIFNSHVMMVSHKVRMAIIPTEADETAWMETLKASDLT